jgi:para-aminobenzoate synthetase component 1
VKIIDGHIYSYPMKGTIDASIPDAKNILIEDEKELSEHYTIVDLIRNDLSIVAKNIRVSKFRYVDTIHTNDKVLLQTSSEITGEVCEEYLKNIGSLMNKVLPAGSITGAPKQKTMSVIKEAEVGNRGWYTGVFGYFDGKNLDSAVAIRFIEKNNGGYIYKSGGGITSMSNVIDEYNELNDKVYVPISREHLD